MKMGVMSEEFRTNDTMEGYKLEQYFFDTRYQILLYSNSQLPLVIVAESEHTHDYFQPFYHSLLRQEYHNFSILLVYSNVSEKEFMRETMLREYPMLLEKTTFLPKSESLSLESILKQFNEEERIVLLLSMKS